MDTGWIKSSCLKKIESALNKNLSGVIEFYTSSSRVTIQKCPKRLVLLNTLYTCSSGQWIQNGSKVPASRNIALALKKILSGIVEIYTCSGRVTSPIRLVLINTLYTSWMLAVLVDTGWIRSSCLPKHYIPILIRISDFGIHYQFRKGDAKERRSKRPITK